MSFDGEHGPCAPEAEPFSYAEACGTAAGAAKESQEVARRREAEAFERGRQTAEQQMQAQLNAAIERAREPLARAVEAFAQERTAYYRRVEGEVVELALAIARKILHRETQVDPRALLGIVRVTLEKLDAGTRVDLYVSPREAADWRHYFATQGDTVATPEVHEDPALPAGECRLETSLGTTEIGIEPQLKEIEAGLLDLLAERPETGAVAPQPASPSLAAAAGATR